MEPSAEVKETFEQPAVQDDEYLEDAWAIGKPYGKFQPIKIARPKIAKDQVRLKILFCGVCHSDVHWGNEDFGPGSCQYPFVAGHEFIGEVLEVGEGVTKFKGGDMVGVGCMVEACMECEFCKNGDEQYCTQGFTGTYNGEKRFGMALGNKELKTHGGYSGSYTVHEKFVLKLPDGMDLAKTSPILCAGITMFDPLKYWGFTQCTGKTVGIVGLGGLGTMGVKLAKAMGHKVAVISTSENKKALAMEKGADVFIASTDPEQIKANAGTIHILLNTVTASHDLNVYLPLLKKNGGNCVQLGGVTTPHPVSQIGLMMTRTCISGSIIGGIASHQEVLEFCAKHNIYPDCETILADKLDMAWENLQKNSAGGLRYVLDIQASIQGGMVAK